MDQLTQSQPQEIPEVETYQSNIGSQSPDTPEKPDHVPEKFWDPEHGTIRAEELLKSYGELERHFSESSPAIPGTPDAYELEMPDHGITPDEEVNNRLHAAGFSHEQAQLVYDLAYEKLAPLLAQADSELQSSAAISQLESHFGGKARWQETSRQIKSWGRSNLEPDVFNTLSSSVDGVKAMHKMMRTSEPSLVGNHSELSGSRGETDLKQMMKDPRYWRDQDPAFVEQVRKGFQALYPE